MNLLKIDLGRFPIVNSIWYNPLIRAILDYLHIFAVCLLTPISIMISQQYDIMSPIAIILLFCDVKTFFMVAIETKTNGLLMVTNLLNFVSFPSVIMIPLHMCSNNTSILWITLGRLSLILKFSNATKILSTKLKYQMPSVYNEYVTKCTLAVLQIYLYISFLACIWFYISCSNRQECTSNDNIELAANYPNSVKNSWVIQDSVIEINSVPSCYVRSLHFVMQTLLTVGYGDIHPWNSAEIIFTIYLILNGSVLYAYLISAITSILDSRDISTKSFRSKIQKMREYFKLRSNSLINSTDLERVKSECINYCNYQFSQQSSTDDSDILDGLPHALQREIRYNYMELLKRLPYFSVQQDTFIETSMKKLVNRTFGPKAVIYDAILSNEMHIIIRGKVDLLSKKSKRILLSFVTGDTIGEFSMLYNAMIGKEHTQEYFMHEEYLAETSTYTNCLSLSYDSFLSALFEANLINDGSKTEENVSEEFENAARDHYCQQAEIKRQSSMYIDSTSTQEYESIQDCLVSKENTLTSGSCCSTELRQRRTMLTTIPQRRSLATAGQSRMSSIGSCQTVHSGLQLSFERNQTFLNKMLKTQEAIDNTAKKKRMAGMLDQYVPQSKVKMILPSSKFYFAWHCIVLLSILYYSFAVPLRIMIYYNCANSDARTEANSTIHKCLSMWSDSLIVDYLCDLVFLVHFILQAKYFAFVQFEGDAEVIVSDEQEIYDKFRRSISFSIIILVIFPVDIISIYTGFLLCLRTIKLFSLILLPQTVGIIQSYLDREAKINISAEAVTVFYLTICVLLVTTLIGVLWEIVRFTGIENFYIDSFYWCFTTMTTTGYGDIISTSTTETIVNIACSFVGPIMFATIIAKISSYVKSVDATTDSLEFRQATALQYLKTSSYLAFSSYSQENKILCESSQDNSSKTQRSSIMRKAASFTSSFYSAGGKYHPKHLKLSYSRTKDKYTSNQNKRENNDAKEESSSILEKLVMEYYLHFEKYRSPELIEEKSLQWMLPEYLNINIRKLITDDLVVSTNIFCKCNMSFRNQISKLLQQIFVNKRNVILNRNIPVTGIYFIRSGAVKIRHSDQKYQIKNQGECFGERSIISEAANLPHYECIATLDCELWYLSRTYFLLSLHYFPENHDKMPFIVNAVNQITNLGNKNSENSVKSAAQPKVKFLLLPNGKIIQCWTLIITVAIIYNAIFLPLRIAYFREVKQSGFELDYVFDCVYVMDMILRMRFLAFYNQDELITDFKLIWKQYFFSCGFIIHILSILPTDMLLLGQHSTRSFSEPQLLSFYRFNRLFRLAEINNNVHQVELIVSYILCKYLYIIKSKNSLRLIKLILGILAVAYIFGTIFFLIASQYHYSGQLNNWLDQIALFDSESSMTSKIINQCIHSTYWAVTVLTTTGYGDIVPVNSIEKIYNMAVFVIGTFVFAMIVVYLQDIVSQLDVTSDIFKKRLSRVHEFLHRENVSTNFSEKVSKYYCKVWAQHKGATGDEIVKFLPNDLYLASIFNIAEPAISKLFFVSKCNEMFQRAFISKLIVRQYLKHDNLFRNGEKSDYLFLIGGGEISLISFDVQIDTVTDVNIDSRFSIRDLTKSPSAGIQCSKARKRKSSYQKITEGFFGDGEFFTRSCYACTGNVTEDSTIFQINFEAFWELVLDHQLVNSYMKSTQKDTARMQRNSTLQIVQKINNNIANAKMTKMLSNSNITKSVEFCILPDSLQKFTWNCLCFAMFCFEAIIIPYFVAFPRLNSFAINISADAVACMLFSVDIFAKLNYFAIIEDGKLITEKRIFRSLYIKSGMKFDIVCTLPYSILIIALRIPHNLEIYSWFRMLYLLRLISIVPVVYDCYRSISNLLQVGLNDAKIRILGTVSAIIYLIHVIAAIFCFIGVQEYNSGKPSWIVVNGYLSLSDKQLYIRGFYWAAYTITTVGYGSITIASNIERTFAGSVMILGSIVCATLSAMLSFLVETSGGSNDTLRKREAIQKFCSTWHVDTSTQQKINDYFKYLQDSSINTFEHDDLQLLPQQLQAEFILQKFWKNIKCRQFLDNSIFDKTSQHGFLLSVLRYAEVYLAIPSETLFRCPYSALFQKDLHIDKMILNRDMYLLRRGVVYCGLQTMKGDIECISYLQENNILCFDSVIPSLTETKSEPRYEYSFKVKNVTLLGRQIANVKMAKICWEIDGISKQSMESTNIMDYDESTNISFDDNSNAELVVEQSNFDIRGAAYIGHSSESQLVYQIGSASIDVDEILRTVRKDLGLTPLNGNEDNSESDNSSESKTEFAIMDLEDSRKLTVKPTVTTRHTKRTKVVPEVAELMEMESIDSSEQSSQISETESMEECSSIKKIYKFQLRASSGKTIGFIDFQITARKNETINANKRHAEELQNSSNLSSPFLNKNRINSILDSKKSPISPTRRRMSGVLLNSIIGSPRSSCNPLELCRESLPFYENSSEYSAIICSQSYSHLFRIPVKKLQSIKTYYERTQDSISTRISSLPK